MAYVVCRYSQPVDGEKKLLFAAVFIANRGEISRRIAISAKSRGLRTSAFIVKGKFPAFLQGLIDDPVWVEEENSALYLAPDKIVAAALKVGAEAVHPGFGFLSERDDFAELVEKSGLIWIGPPVSAMAGLADKSHARAIALRAEVPCTEAISGGDQDPASFILELEKKRQQLQFPLLVKAAMGGGGKGMRIVNNWQELQEAVPRAASEALSSFGCGRLIVETWVANARHVEVQVFGDHHGQVVILGDRDCSMQRRHQKIIEEAPAPNLRPEVRKAMHDAAKKLAKEVGYYSAGTVEYIVDEQQRFYFLEMNTRLQVEHPVTEEVYGLDLVGLQFSIAAGHPLSAELASRPVNGHAMEARIYAEDPWQEFIPTPAMVYSFDFFRGPQVRWEIGVEAGLPISDHFDPMIAKLVVHGEDREDCCRRMEFVLRQSSIMGPRTNLSFLQALLSTEFREKPQSTSFIGKKMPSMKIKHAELAAELCQQASELVGKLRTLGVVEKLGDSSFDRFLQKTFQASEVPCESSTLQFFPNTATDSFLQKSGKVLQTIEEGPLASSRWWSYLLVGDKIFVETAGEILEFSRDSKKQSWATSSGSEGSGDGALQSPVPGKLFKMVVAVDQMVATGDLCAIVESMKMEFEVRADRPGKVEKISAKVGDQLVAGALLLKISEIV